MNEIVSVINKMIDNKKAIGNVQLAGRVYFFTYKGKYIFSIHPKASSPDNSRFYLNLYPSQKYDLSYILDVFNGGQPESQSDWDGFERITYDSEDYKSVEADESFKDLYQTVQSKIYGVDEVFRAILEDEDDL